MALAIRQPQAAANRGSGDAPIGAVRESVGGSNGAFRHENDIQNLRVWNVTLGQDVTRAFRRASSPQSVLDVRNFLLLGTRLPDQASGPSNLAVDASSFVGAAADDYQLTPDCPAIGAA